MSPDNQNVGATPEDGAAGQPVQPVSPAEPKPIDGEAIKLLTELGESQRRLEKELRGLQSRQDKNDNTVGTFQEQLAKYQQYVDKGLKPNEALAEMQRVDADAQWRQDMQKQLQDIAGRIGGNGNVSPAQQMVAEVLAEFKLDPKHTYVASQLLGKTFANRAEAEVFAGRVFRDMTLSPNPNNAQGATQPGEVAGQTDYNALAAEYDVLRKNPTAPGNIERMAEISERLGSL